MNVDTCRFLLNSPSENFAKELYQRWDEFFRNSFEKVFEEEWSSFDNDDDIIDIENLELDLGIVSEEHFDQEFSTKLRKKLRLLKLQLLNAPSSVKCGDSKVNVCRKSKSLSAYEHLIYFLLHGCLLPDVDDKFLDISYLLRMTLESSSSLFRSFLESYGHYDFILQRLSQQFKDEELELLVQTLHPDESKYVCLYVRLHMAEYKSYAHNLQLSVVDDVAYRNVLWQVVFSYLYTEGKTWFSKKQFIAYTLKRLSAHYNLELSLLVKWIVIALNEMEAFSAYRIEFTDLLVEIMKENDCVSCDPADADTVISVIQSKANNPLFKNFLISRDNLLFVLSDETNLRRIVSVLPDQEIKNVISILFPQEASFIFCFDNRIERNKNKGVLSGKCGNEYSKIKWQFMLRVAIGMPELSFPRLLFVQSVIKEMSNHYNVSIADLLSLFLDGMDDDSTPMAVSLTTILSDLQRLYDDVSPNHSIMDEKKSAVVDTHELISIVQDHILFQKFYSQHTEIELEQLIASLHPADSSFIILYARNLTYHGGALLEGKVNDDFSLLKWRLLFSCLIIPQGSIYSRKLYVLRVLKELSSHYNLALSDVLRTYGLMLEANGNSGDKKIIELLTIVEDLFMELVQGQNSMTENETRQMLLLSFGRNNVPVEYQKKSLDFVMSSYPQMLASLWKSGELSVYEILICLKNVPDKMLLFLDCISDSRINMVLDELKHLYHELVAYGVSASILNESAEQFLSRLILLSSKTYFSWSLKEIKDCLKDVIDLSSLKRDLKNKVLSYANELNDGGINTIEQEKTKQGKELYAQLDMYQKKMDIEGLLESEVIKEKQIWKIENAGLVLLSPYLPRLFQYAGYLNSEGKDFLNDESRIRAIFLLQYIVYGEEREYNEAVLFLNRLLVGLKFTCPIPLSCKLTENEIKLSESVLGDIKYQWTKMSHTSNEGFRVSFLQRTANLKCENERTWQMNVDKRAYDVLLETIPWSFRMIKYHWIERLIVVEWNYK